MGRVTLWTHATVVPVRETHPADLARYLESGSGGLATKTVKVNGRLRETLEQAGTVIWQAV